MWSFGIIVLLVLIAVLWIDSLKIRERATGICKSACRRHNVQLLDQTISLAKLAVRWTQQGIRLKRTYRFEYSEDGNNRLDGHIVMTGAQMTEFSMGLPSTQDD